MSPERRSQVVWTVAIALAVVSCSLVAGQFLADRNARMAMTVAPIVPEARARYAVSIYDERPDVAAPAARRARAIDPLEDNAIAVLARDEPDDARREVILDAAERVTRRGRNLLPIMLAHEGRTGDREGFSEVLDRILTVYPRARELVVGLLADFLYDPVGPETMRELLDQGPDWRDQLFVEAGNREGLAMTLYRLRETLPADAPLSADAERAVIRALVREKQFAQGWEVYDAVQGGDINMRSWEGRYPEFEWSPARSPGMQIRPAANGRSGELLLRWNRRGEITHRLIVTERPLSRVDINHDLAPADLSGRVRVRIACAGTGEVIGRAPLVSSPTSIDLPPRHCAAYRLSLIAGTPSQARTLRGRVGPLAYTRY